MKTGINVTRSSMVGGLAASASAQHVEAPISTKMTFRIAEVGFVVNINIFAPG